MKAKTWKAWSQRESDAAETMLLDGRSCIEIAAALGRTVPSVRCHFAEKGISSPGVTGRWYAALSRPHTMRGVAAAMGVSVGAVKQQKRKLRRAGFDIPNATWADGKVRGRVDGYKPTKESR